MLESVGKYGEKGIKSHRGAQKAVKSRGLLGFGVQFQLVGVPDRMGSGNTTP